MQHSWFKAQPTLCSYIPPELLSIFVCDHSHYNCSGWGEDQLKLLWVRWRSTGTALGEVKFNWNCSGWGEDQLKLLWARWRSIETTLGEVKINWNNSGWGNINWNNSGWGKDQLKLLWVMWISTETTLGEVKIKYQVLIQLTKTLKVTRTFECPALRKWGNRSFLYVLIPQHRLYTQWIFPVPKSAEFLAFSRADHVQVTASESLSKVVSLHFLKQRLLYLSNLRNSIKVLTFIHFSYMRHVSADNFGDHQIVLQKYEK
jgi:hypothetical protein